MWLAGLLLLSTTLTTTLSHSLATLASRAMCMAEGCLQENCLKDCLPTKLQYIQDTVHRLSSTEKKPTYAGAKLWNALPEELKSTDRQYFGWRLKQWLQDHPFYTLKEFYERTNTT